MNEGMKTIFLGNPLFSIPSLEVLLNTSWIDLIAVCTNPDKPANRGKKLAEPPVKTLALEKGIPLFQTKSLRKEKEVIEKIKQLNPDIMVSCSYGQILSQEVLDIAPVINVHASLLPKYRGAAPINWAILNGDNETGITIMKTVLALDAGPIILQEKFSINQNENSNDLIKKLSTFGAEVLIKALELIKNGKAKYTPQDDSKATLAPMLKKEQGLINWNKSSFEIHNQIRGLQPWPSAYTHYKSKTIKIWESRIKQSTVDSGQWTGEAGTIVELGDYVKVKTADGYLDIYKLQPENRNILSAKDWINGARVKIGDTFT